VSGPAVPVGGGVPVDPETGERYGFLPRKAAQRKVILRRQLGTPWFIGALVAGALILVIGVGYLLSRPDVPGRPYVDRGPLPVNSLTTLPTGEIVDQFGGLLVLAPGSTPCPRGLWTGARLPARAANGHLYVDPTHPDPLPPCGH
jgi:hypothetical protein